MSTESISAPAATPSPSSTLDILNAMNILNSEHLFDPPASLKWFDDPILNRAVHVGTIALVALLGIMAKNLVFGELRVSEFQNLRDKFNAYMYNKALFMFGIIGVQSFDETVPWFLWYTILVFLLMITYLCKDRFDYLALSPSTSSSSLLRLGITMLLVLAASVSCLVRVLAHSQQLGWDTMFYLLADTLYVTVMSIFALVRYAIHMHSIYTDQVWEERASFTYYTELVFELTLLAIDFANHMQMFRVNSFVSVPTILCGVKLHSLFREMRMRRKRHHNYLAVVALMESNFPMATNEELERNCDDCSICWDKMETARKLPCGHLFHNSCLRSWLEQDTSCPTCRSSLKSSTRHGVGDNQHDEHDEEGLSTNDSDIDDTETAADASGEAQISGAHNHHHRDTHMFARSQYFHFDTSRYSTHPLLSWLPAISIEASWLGWRDSNEFELDRNDRFHRLRQQQQPQLNQQQTQQQNQSQSGQSNNSDSPHHNHSLSSSLSPVPSDVFDSYAVEQIHEMFPDYDRQLILADLQISQSLEQTIDNIIERRAPFNSTTIGSRVS